MTRANDNIAIELKGISKAFGSVIANNNINLSVRKGEILALLGENGSGKTTLMNMISGIYRPDSGTIKINGEEVIINSPEDANRLGIGMIHQHFKLVNVMTAADNIVLAGEKRGLWLKKSRIDKTKEISEQFGFEINPNKLVGEMSVGEKQTVEIIKVLYRDAEILILDEPTAVLTPQEITRLFEILRKMKETGKAIIIITHKLNEVLEISDRVTVLRKGEAVATVDTAKADERELTALMVGHPVELSLERPQTSFSERLLELRHITVENEDGVEVLKDIDFSLNRGEVLGVVGVAGSGQRELCETIYGLLTPKKGAVLYHDEDITYQNIREIIKRGISLSFVPEDRLGMGLAASLNIVDNVLLKNYNQTSKSIFINKHEAREVSKKLVQRLQIVTPNVDTPVRLLSGGNVQKVLLGREIEANPEVLIVGYPVRGLDINSSYVVYDEINEQKRKGVGIIFIGEDLDVMLGICDRIMVLCHGEIVDIVNATQITKEQIGLMMTGKTMEEAERNA